MRAPLVVAALALAACGDGIYTAQGLPPLGGGGGGTCTDPTVQCPGSTDCLAPTVDHCSQCSPCQSAPFNGKVECLPVNGTTRPYSCVPSCDPGWLFDGSGCSRAVAVAAGGDHTCAVTASGKLRCWGANGKGQVTGDTSSVAEPLPRPVTGVVGNAAPLLAAGFEHTCAVVDTSIQCWGANLDGQSTVPSLQGAVTGLAAGRAHTCAVAGGSVRCWGANDQGQLGVPAGLTNVARIVAGANHTCTLHTDGAVRCWGENGKSQLGPGPGSPFAAGSGLRSIAAGHDHTCVADGVNDGLLCWGANLGGVVLPGLADPQPTPAIPPKEGGSGQPIVGGKVVGLMAAGRAHTCATLPIATGVPELPVCFGDNRFLQLGELTPPPQNSVAVRGLSPDPPVISAGADHTCALLADSSLKCWGRNHFGQLGDGTTQTPTTPGAVFVSGR